MPFAAQRHAGKIWIPQACIYLLLIYLYSYDATLYYLLLFYFTHMLWPTHLTQSLILEAAEHIQRPKTLRLFTVQNGETSTYGIVQKVARLKNIFIAHR
jgi:hypothetical protein